MKKTRRANAAYASSGGLFAAWDEAYLHRPGPTSQAARALEFGRPDL
ncbi:hypothetical protein [Hymenobacter sp. B1770]